MDTSRIWPLSTRPPSLPSLKVSTKRESITLKTFLDDCKSPILSSSMACMVFCRRSGLLDLETLVDLGFSCRDGADVGVPDGDRWRSALRSVRYWLSRIELHVCRRMASLVEKACLHLLAHTIDGDGTLGSDDDPTCFSTDAALDFLAKTGGFLTMTCCCCCCC